MLAGASLPASAHVLPKPPTSSPSTLNRVVMRASVAVQGNGVLNFGKLVWIEGSMVYVEVDSELKSGDRATLRVDLSPAPGTVLMDGEVARPISSAPGQPNAYLVKLISVSAADSARWQQFLVAKSGGIAVSDRAIVDDSATPSNISQGSMGSMGSDGRGLFGSVPGARSVSSLPSAGGSAAAGARAVMRDALKSAIIRPPESPVPPIGTSPQMPAAGPSEASSSRTVPSAKSTSGSASADWGRTHAPPKPTPPPEVVSPPRLPPRAPQRSGLNQAPSTVGPPGGDPSWMASNVAGRCYVEIKWRSEETFHSDVHMQLTSNVITLLGDGRPLPTSPPIHFVLRYGTLAVQTPATPIRILPLAVTYRLELDSSHLAELRRHAPTPSTSSRANRGTPTR